MQEEENSEQNSDIVFEEAPEAPPRIVGIYGEIADESVSEFIGSLLGYYHDRQSPPDSEGNCVALPVEFIISTGGGNVADMFSAYDVMRMVREECPIHTLGVGKVMSAGVLLLAAGTKGKRRIGKYCRIMLHHVLGAEQGSVVDIGQSYEEAKVMEHNMFEAIAQESNLTLEELQEIVSKNTDVFFSAEEAVEMGIADIIV
jgi:ATP-dependent Clp protease protease subunit